MEFCVFQFVSIASHLPLGTTEQNLSLLPLLLNHIFMGKYKSPLSPPPS